MFCLQIRHNSTIQSLLLQCSVNSTLYDEVLKLLCNTIFTLQSKKYLTYYILQYLLDIHLHDVTLHNNTGLHNIIWRYLRNYIIFL